jgi:NADH-quinone oxidoreductase subunit M
VGLPGLNGFIGEFLCLIGAFTATSGGAYPGVLGPWYAAVAGLGMVFAALYLLIMTGKVVFGPLREPAAHLGGGGGEGGAHPPADLSPREIGILAPLAVLCLAIGLQPAPLTDAIEGSIAATLERYPEAVEAHLARSAPNDPPGGARAERPAP